MRLYFSYFRQFVDQLLGGHSRLAIVVFSDSWHHVDSTYIVLLYSFPMSTWPMSIILVHGKCNFFIMSWQTVAER